MSIEVNIRITRKKNKAYFEVCAPNILSIYFSLFIIFNFHQFEIRLNIINNYLALISSIQNWWAVAVWHQAEEVSCEKINSIIHKSISKWMTSLEQKHDAYKKGISNWKACERESFSYFVSPGLFKITKRSDCCESS